MNIEKVKCFFTKARIKLAWFFWRILLGPVAGRLPKNLIFSLYHSKDLQNISGHFSKSKLVRDCDTVTWSFSRDFPPWVHRKFHFFQLHRFLLSNVYIGPTSGIVFTPSGQVFAESVGSLNKILTFGKALQDLAFHSGSYKFQNPKGDSKEYSMLLAAPPVGFYHWIYEILPNLIRLLRDFPEALLISTPDKPAYLGQTLEFIFKGFNPRSRFVCSWAPVYCRRSAFIPVTPGSGFIHPDDIFLIRESILSSTSSASNKEINRKVFISRKNSPSRYIANNDQIEKKYVEMGFEIIHFEFLPFHKQVECVAAAAEIAGLHGAGFSNIVFAPPTCKIHEIFPPNYPNDCYARIAATLGMNYSMEILS